MLMRLTTAAVLAGFAGVAGAAADWTFNPRITVQAETDDNNRLTNVRGEEIEVEGFAVDAQLGVRAQTPRSELNLTPRVQASFYPDEPDEERQMGSVTGDWRYGGERWNARVDGSFSVRTILGRVYPDGDGGGLGEPDPGTGSGRTGEETDQYSLLFRPRLDFALTERTSLLLELRRKDVEFDDQVENDRQNFEDTSVSTGVSFKTSETAALTFMAGAGVYEPEDGFDSDSQFVTAEWSNMISETSRYYFRVGSDRVKNDVPDADWENAFSGGAGIAWQFEVTELFLDYNHYLDPSPSGRMVNRDQLRFELLRQLSERSSLRLSARAVIDEKAVDEDDLENREFANATIQYEWRFQRQFSLLAGYDYTWRDYETDPTDATSNRFFLGVRYQPNRR